MGSNTKLRIRSMVTIAPPIICIMFPIVKKVDAFVCGGGEVGERNSSTDISVGRRLLKVVMNWSQVALSTVWMMVGVR